MSRIPIAAVAGLAGFIAYVVAAVTLADQMLKLNWAVQALYFVVAGTLWALPAKWLMVWAARK